MVEKNNIIFKTDFNLELDIIELNKIFSYIKIGNNKALEAKNRDIVIVIGKTGSGKSTFLNYVNGCTLNIDKYSKKIIVDSNSPVKEIFPIGHENNSKTLTPELVYNKLDDILYVDFPGFNDNRGFEINISNSITLKNLIVNSKSVKVIIVCEAITINTERGKGINELFKYLISMFNGTKNIVENKKSILFLITNHSKLINDFEYDFEDIIKETFKNYEDLISLKDSILFYDPKDSKKELKCRKEIISIIKSMTAIKNTTIFNLILNENDIESLNNKADIALRVIKKCIEYDFLIDNLDLIDNFKNIGSILKGLNYLLCVDNDYIENIYKYISTLVIEKIDLLKQQLIKAYNQDYDEINEFKLNQLLDNYSESQTFFNFDEKLSSNFNIFYLYNKINELKIIKNKEKEEQEKIRLELELRDHTYAILLELEDSLQLQNFYNLEYLEFKREEIENERKSNLEIAKIKYEDDLEKIYEVKKNAENDILSLREIIKIQKEEMEEKISRENSYFKFRKKTLENNHQENLEKLIEDQNNKEKEINDKMNNEITQINQRYTQEYRYIEENTRINLNALIDRYNWELNNFRN